MGPIESVYTISGRGVVVTGSVEQGQIKPGMDLELVGVNKPVATVCTGLESFRKELADARAGDNAGVLLRHITKDQVQRGQVIAAPGTVKAYSKFKARFYALTAEEGGR